MKNLLHSNIVQSALPPLAAGFLKSSRLGLRMVRDDSPKGQAIIASGKPVLACFWHNRLLAIPVCWRGAGVDMLISQSRDGRLIAETAKYFGHGYIVGSTARGQRDRRSMAAARDVIGKLGSGRFVGMTPDGPRGPRQRASAGVIRLAQMAEVDIVPVAASMSNTWRAKSWDRMMVPYPSLMARGALLIGDPIPVPNDISAAERTVLLSRLEQVLNAMTAEADNLTGVPLIEPAAPVAA